MTSGDIFKKMSAKNPQHPTPKEVIFDARLRLKRLDKLKSVINAEGVAPDSTRRVLLVLVMLHDWKPFCFLFE